MNEEQLRALKALSDTTRCRIVTMLLSTSLCVGGLARRLGLSEPAISQHLQVLKQAGLVLSEKKGYYVHNTANTEELLRLAQTLRQWVLTGGESLDECRHGEPGRCSKKCQDVEVRRQDCEKLRSTK